MSGVEKATFNFHLVVTMAGAGLGQVRPGVGPCVSQFLLDSSALLVVFVE